MSFDVNITVNGNRCKIYNYQGKQFIEAKNGSEYAIEIKNNSYTRILAVSSVDGLNVLTGKTAKEGDTGYIIGTYSSEKIKGFRFSDEGWAMFKFGYKFNGKTYAQSKEDDSEKNCGVIGVRLFYENISSYTITDNSPTGGYWPKNYGSPDWYGNYGSPDWYGNYVNYCGNPTNLNNINISNAIDSSKEQTTKGGRICASPRYTAGGQSGGMSSLSHATNHTPKIELIACASAQQPNFDMGTEWGRKEHSKIKTTSFDKGTLAHTVDIFYASREMLIQMGVPLDNNLKVNLPQSFPSNYAEPPKGWNG